MNTKKPTFTGVTPIPNNKLFYVVQHKNRVFMHCYVEKR